MSALLEPMSDSEASSPTSSVQSDGPTNNGKPSGPTKKKSGKSSKPRLTATQKNTNHKDAENKRRNAIRERFTDLSRMVPGAEGQERSEQVMLGKTTEFLKEMLEEQRRLEDLAEQRGIMLDEKNRLQDTDYGGSKWAPINMDAYHAAKAKKLGPEG
ncbi:hypothetical protein R6Q59_010202 [Mikania micrantha]